MADEATNTITVDLGSSGQGFETTLTMNDVLAGPDIFCSTTVPANYTYNANVPLITTGISFTAQPAPAIQIEAAANGPVIRTQKNEINIDDLADTLKILQKRLLILTPDFEKHEKYPMLKELYNEYKAIEKLLSGPDSNE